MRPDGSRTRHPSKDGTPRHRDTETDRPGLAPRRTAARLLAAVVDAHTALDGLTDNMHGHPHYLALEPRDRALTRAILVSALRHRATIETLIGGRLDRPLPANARSLSHILHVGAAQILFLDVPDSAAVDLAVAHAGADPRTRRFAALVNAVLRAIARGKDTALPKALAETRDMPEWLYARLCESYGVAEADAIAAAHRVEAPFDFSVRSDAEGWARALGGIVLPTGSVRVERLSGPVGGLPGYPDGQWWVQDAAAALPARLLGDIAGLRVADLCAAPGGKTAQLALAGAEVTAIDISANRAARLRENLARLGLEARVVVADIFGLAEEIPFDAVLLDAPCSSTGTIRRHPDIAWTKTPADVEKLARLQRRLLDKAFELVKPGGRLVFSNCSLDRQEGEQLRAAFLEDTPAVRHDPVRADEFAGIESFITPEGTLRTTPAGMPHERPALSGLDGFFAARFVKAA